MKDKIKYDIGDELYFMEDNKIKKEKVFEITFTERAVWYFYF